MKNPKVLLPVLLLLLGGVYKFVLAKPAPVHKPKIAGEVYVLPKDFLVNLKGGHFVKLNTALVLAEGYLAAGHAGGGHAAAATPPAGYGVMPQEPVVRAIITESITGLPQSRLLQEESRLKVQQGILKRINKETDVEVEDVLFTDVSVQ
jgi:hypothetical protein